MRAVKGKNTRPEMTVRSALHKRGFRYRLHDKKLPGTPDIVFPSKLKVIFVHGCFWHGHDCERGARIPKTNADYWRRKIAANKVRDAQNNIHLHDLGWNVLAIWECEITSQNKWLKKAQGFLRNERN